jgi:hypothetical protein
VALEVIFVENLFPKRIAQGLEAAEMAKEESIRIIADGARSRVPVLTGETRDSIEELSDGVQVGGAGIFLEFGTRKMAPHPFLLQGMPEGEAGADGVLRIAFSR